MEGKLGDEGWNWMHSNLGNVLLPRDWDSVRLGTGRKAAPVVSITWYEANAYCKWLLRHWDELEEGQGDIPKPQLIR